MHLEKVIKRGSSICLAISWNWNRFILAILCLGCCLPSVQAQSKHSPRSNFATYEGRVMSGYQGWFRAPDDGANEGWGHYSGRGPLTASTFRLDFWPDVSEYEKTYSTSLTDKDGSVARVFSSVDQSTTDLHFRWMQQYGGCSVMLGVPTYFRDLKVD